MNNYRNFELNDLLYASVNEDEVNMYHQFARVDNISTTGKLKLSLFTSIQDGKRINKHDITYIPVRPNIETIKKVKLANNDGYQTSLNCTFIKYDNNVLYDIVQNEKSYISC